MDSQKTVSRSGLLLRFSLRLAAVVACIAALFTFALLLYKDHCVAAAELRLLPSVPVIDLIHEVEGPDFWHLECGILSTAIGRTSGGPLFQVYRYGGYNMRRGPLFAWGKTQDGRYFSLLELTVGWTSNRQGRIVFANGHLAHMVLPLAVTAISLRWVQHRQRPRPPHLCPACGYDIRAATTRCPECGTPAPENRP